MKRLLIGFILLLTGCKVGPDYEQPPSPMPLEYTEANSGMTRDADGEDFFRWWMTFNDPLLDQFLEESIQGNFDYRIALEKVLQARSQYWIQATQVQPSLMSDIQESHFRTIQSFASRNESAAPAALGTTISPIQNFFQAGFDAVWQIDLFGGLR